ncbi:HD domain-containing protein [Parafrankia sp. BMG5.11]|uniref:HD domain-containing protein n=1 Tax=Parafrankia sp. BMG5.11 TaxID=222540 RepID=UPI00103C1736|nr:HD domain-containing protein [Parafrankia sp. BMG5.11]TCJ41284.1 HD domain-containing protein [Parafrankia sp. BMG5.11]
MTDLTERFQQALVFAVELHRDQRRKGTEIPYVSHLLGVASIALEIGADEDQAIAALLHDAVEDQGGAKCLEEIRDRYGDRVADIVSDCTDADTDPKPPWRARKNAYIASLAHKHPDSLLVSLADKTHNARAILDDLVVHGPSLWDRFTGGREGSLWYYDELAKAFRIHLPGAAAERLVFVVGEMHRAA